MAKGNLAFTVSFQTKEKDGIYDEEGNLIEEATDLIIALDSEKNKDKTVFGFDESVFFYVISNVEYKVGQSAGETFQAFETLELTLTEYVTFAQESSGTVTKPIGNIQSFVWHGNKEPAITTQGNAIILNKDSIGVLEITYTASADSWWLQSVQKPAEDFKGEYPVVVVAYKE